MKIEIHFHQMESSPAIKNRITEASERLEHYLGEGDSLKVMVGANGHHQVYAEVFWHDHSEKRDFFAKEEAKQGQDLYALIDLVFEKVHAQVHKAHDRRLERRQKKEPLKKLSQGK